MEDIVYFKKQCPECNQLRKFKHKGNKIVGKKCMACYSKKSNAKTNAQNPEYYKTYYETHKETIKEQAKNNYLRKKNRVMLDLQLLEPNDSDEFYDNMDGEHRAADILDRDFDAEQEQAWAEWEAHIQAGGDITTF